jgi:hypothetical protein
MIENYAFLAAFALQVLMMSVVLPAWFIRSIRRQAAAFPAERLAQVYPGVDHTQKLGHYLGWFLGINTLIALLGASLLAWMFSRMETPDWNHSAGVYASFFFMLQALPIGLGALMVTRVRMTVLKRSSPEGKRKASLQHRGLFDFVSPVAIALSAIAYVLFAAYVLYLREHPFPGFAGLVNLAAMSLVYALNAFGIYWLMYGRKINAVETQANSQRTIGRSVRGLVYAPIACIVFLSVDFTLRAWDLRSWQPVATSVFFVICALFSVKAMIAPDRGGEARA